MEALGIFMQASSRIRVAADKGRWSVRVASDVVVAVELHAQLNAFPAAFQAMLIGVA
jgi:hypothetical protein